MRLIAEQIRSLIKDQEWTGTSTELAATLNSPGSPVSSAHLAISLRRHEPLLWWDHGISVRFSRTGRRRLVHLARREGWTDQRLRAGDGLDKNLTVTVKL
jgi:hypothetical protein